MNFCPPSTKGYGNSAAEPKVRRQKRARNLSNSSGPRDPSYKIERTELRSAAARANAPVEEAHRPIEEEEVSQLDIVDDNDVYHGNDDDEEECVVSETMDLDDDEEEQKVDDEEEEQGGGDVLGTVVLSRKSKLALKDTDL